MFDLEYSETMLYHVRLLEELGEFSQALSTLDVNSKSRAILDRTTVMETRGGLSDTKSSPRLYSSLSKLVFSVHLLRPMPKMPGAP